MHTYTQPQNTQRRCGYASGRHPCPGRQRGGGGPAERELPRLPPYPAFLPPTGATTGGRERARGTTEMLHVATAKSATDEEGEPNSRERERESWGVQDEKRQRRKREKALTGLSMSAVRAGLGPGARQPRRQRGLPGVADHASITMSQVGQAAKTSNKCNRAPLLTDFTAPICLSSLSLSPTLPPFSTYALSLPLALSKALALSPPHLFYCWQPKLIQTITLTLYFIFHIEML